ncbi:phage protein [Priestia aryabhattai]|uniref:phage protein n=1 Tax=Priestia megaterium TaxID=1404 RepID=UPI0039B97724
MSNELFGRVIKVHIEGDYKADFSNEDFHIRFEVPFDDDSTPNQITVEIYNLSNTSINHIKKDCTLILQAGYKSDYGILSQGKISSVLTKRDGVDKITTIYMTEGQDYSGVKVSSSTSTSKKSLEIAFAKGTKADVIIKRLVSALGIRLGEMKLPKNPSYTSGYTVTGNILNNLNEVVKDCGAALYYRKGTLVVRSIKEGTDERFVLEEATGLLGSPDPFEEDDYKGYTANCLLQHRISTASIVQIKSKTANGQYRAKKGKHIASGSDFKTEVTVI